MLQCWCGSGCLSLFSADYMRCLICETLVSQSAASTEQSAVCDDESDFYGKQYWLSHQANDLGHPDIYSRARYDLTERNLHWLNTLLKYALPTAKVLDLGCSHGSFVALMAQAGYDATGVEMSPWVVDYGRKTFEVPIHVGPIEKLDIPEQSLDAIVLMDVLEHLPDPVTTMSYCLRLLKSDGFLLIQTPEFKSNMRYEFLVSQKSPFLNMLQADEHLYLFSQQSVIQLLQKLGASHVYFEPAIFSNYDMFLVASQSSIERCSPHQVEDTLLKTPSGRLTLALLNLRAQVVTLEQQFQQADTDRKARLQQVDILTQQVDILTQQVEKQAEKERSTFTYKLKQWLNRKK